MSRKAHENPAHFPTHLCGTLPAQTHHKGNLTSGMDFSKYVHADLQLHMLTFRKCFAFNLLVNHIIVHETKGALFAWN